MYDDPIIAEVRRVKDAIAARYGHDVRKRGRALMRAQKKSGHRVVSFAQPRTATKRAK